MKNILTTLSAAILVILIIDFIAFMLWALSGQEPQSSIYFGILTKTVLTSICY